MRFFSSFHYGFLDFWTDHDEAPWQCRCPLPGNSSPVVQIAIWQPASWAIQQLISETPYGWDLARIRLPDRASSEVVVWLRSTL